MGEYESNDTMQMLSDDDNAQYIMDAADDENNEHLDDLTVPMLNGNGSEIMKKKKRKNICIKRENKKECFAVHPCLPILVKKKLIFRRRLNHSKNIIIKRKNIRNDITKMERAKRRKKNDTNPNIEIKDTNKECLILYMFCYIFFPVK